MLFKKIVGFVFLKSFRFLYTFFLKPTMER